MRRPWNIVDVPVYSLATYDGEKVNMNICTYVSPISMKPKQYIVAIYYNTKTLSNISTSDAAVLQLLHQDHIHLVHPLGKKSGLKMDKAAWLDQHSLLMKWNEKPVLKGARAYIQLKKLGNADTGGDHELYWFEATKSRTNKEEGILTFNDLIEQGVIL